MKKLTAVEWLIEEYINGAVINIQIMKKALEIEREQIKDAFFEGKNDGILMERYLDYKHITPDEYYNETFKSE